jgi:hypothetical protein
MTYFRFVRVLFSFQHNDESLKRELKKKKKKNEKFLHLNFLAVLD